MAAFKTSLASDYESDMSDEGGDEEVLSGWLDEEEPEEEEKPKPVVVEQPKIDIVRKSKYIVENVDLFYALCEVDDWGFIDFPEIMQEDIMKSLTIRSYQPGENIIIEGDGGNDCYIVSASEETAHYAEVEVVTGNILEGTEVFLTRLQRGQYFGQKYFLTRRAQKRGATVRVPKDAKVAVNVAVLTPEHFDKWDTFRNLLLVKTVPMVQMLPRKERQKILQNLFIRDFKDGEYIIRQGEQGEEFFIIQEGSVRVVESRPSPEFGWDKPDEHTLVTLREGHFFGEMALVTNEPRVASVVCASKLTICLVLAKKDFRAALSDETFGEVLSEVLAKRKTIRAQRESNAEENSSQLNSPASRDSLGGDSVSSKQSSSSSRRSSRRRNPSSAAASEVSVSTTLSMRKLESGSRVVNKYIVEKELGKGSFGEVYLCRDQETDEPYAMKMINRPQSSWNDDASSSIRQEIAVMKRLQHNNIVNLHEVIDDQNARKIFLIQEYMEGGPLMSDAETCEPVDIILARKYFRDILRGVCYLHSEGIIHRDIKPQNMLLSADGTVKIADFGAAVFTTANEKVAYGGTPAFMAPELFLTNTGVDYTKNEGIDVFALGATLYFMLCGKPPWMAKNQLDLATKIKNIELTFPTTAIDPHVKHLLRQMLAKDHRTRCSLDTIVIDDWVTFEGSEPLFDTVDFDGTSYADFMSFAAREDSTFEGAYYVLIMDKKFVNRTMLSQKINNIHAAVCACLESPEQVLAMMASARTHNASNNFDYVFIEVRPDNNGLETIKEIRRLGYSGRLIAVNYGAQETSELANPDAADAVVSFPVPVRDLSKILSTDSFEEVQTMQRMDSGAGGVTLEDLDAAITCHAHVALAGEEEAMTEDATSSRPSLGSISVDQESELLEGDNEPEAEEANVPEDNLHDFQQQSSRNLHNMSTKTEMTVSTDGADEYLDQFRDGPNESRLNINSSKNLSRKRAFKVVPYSSSVDASSEKSPKGGKGTFDRGFPAVQPTVVRSDSDRQLLLMPLATRDENRRKRREAAMNRSRLAHQYRTAKSSGDEKAMHSSKSLLNLLGKNKSKRMSRAIKTAEIARAEAAEDEDEQSIAAQRAKDMEDFLADNAEAVSEKGNNDSNNNLDISGVTGSGYNLQSNSTSSHSMHRGLSARKPPARFNVPDDSDDSDTGDIVSDSDWDEHDEDDEDYGAVETLEHLDDAGLDAVFDAIADCGKQNKESDENADLVEWNHIMVSKGINSKLIAPAHMTNVDLEIKVAMSESIVSRSYMEDRSYANVNEPGSRSKGCSPLAICAVFDGHNGTYASQMLQDRFASTFTSLFRAAELKSDFRDATYSNHVVGIFEETCAMLDVELLRADYIRQQNTIKSGIQDVQSFAGSVAVMMAITPVVAVDVQAGNMKQGQRVKFGDEEVGKVQAFVAHVGDCRAVLCNDGVAVPLTVDHKPSLKSEKARIEAAGGWVQSGRVNGSLGVSRSFGDIQFKSFDETPGQVHGVDNFAASIWNHNQQVISRPEVKHFVVEKPFEFVILACDGLWDVFDDQEAVNFVRKRLSVNRSVEKTAQELVQKAIKRGTQDNTSVVIVVFHQTEIASL